MIRFRTILLFAVAASMALFGACNFAPHYHKPPPVETPAAYKETNIWKTAQPADAQLKGNWWEMFNDPELNRLEAQVAISNQNVIAGLENFLAARAVARQAWAGFFPTATFSPSYQKSPIVSTAGGGAVTVTGAGVGTGTNRSGSSSAVRGSSSFNLPVNASWAPDLWSSIRNTVRSSVYAAQSSAAQFENLRLTAQAELAQDYFQLRLQDELIRVYYSNVTNYEQSLELTKTLASTGINSELDVLQAQTTLETAQAESTGLLITRAQLEHAIAMLIGRAAPAFSIPPAQVKINTPAIPQGVPSQLLERRPDIAAAERLVAEANANIGVARAAYFPTLTLTGGTGFQSSSISTLLNSSSFYWSFGATLAETIFDAGRRRAVTRQAWATFNANVANYRQTTLVAFQQVEDNLAGLRILSQQLEQQTRAVESSRKNVELAVERYRLGINSYINVITAEQTLLANQQTLVTLRSQQMTDTVQLILALGGGWDEKDIPGFNAVVHGKEPKPTKP